LQAAVIAGQVDAQGDPVMTWAAGNAVVQTDGKGNIYPVKKRSRGRIDPLMAACIAWSIALKATEAPIPQIHV
jgi:phage terminase large subunit-like protein